MITKETVTLCDNITEAGHIGVKTITRVMEDGVKLSETIHRKVLSPGDDITNEPPEVQAVARGIWTPAVVAPFTTAQQAAIAELIAKTTAAATAKAAVDAEAAALETSKEAAQVSLAELTAQRTAVDTETAALAAKIVERDALTEEFTPTGVPKSVTMRQARLALLGAGLLDDIDAAIAALPAANKKAALIEWEYSNDVQRHNGFVDALAPILNLTSAQIDQLFVTARTL